MIRTLLTTTALVAVLSTGAMAQDAVTATPDMSGGVLAKGYTSTDSDNLATEIIGKQVYASAAADAEHIGDVNNLVIGDDGDVAAVIIGVGGFLGMGEKNVAVSMDELEWVTAEDNTERYVLNTSKDALASAPDFTWTDDQPDTAAAPAADDAMAPADDQMAATPAAPADDAMAPADDQMAAAPAAPADDAMAPADDQMAAAPADDAAAPVDQTATGTTAPADTATTPAAGSAMDPLDRTNMAEFDEMQLTAEELIGTNVYGTNDEHIGAIGDLALNEDGSIDAIIIDFGGFLGIGTKPVAVGYENLDFLSDPENTNRSLVLPITREQMEAAPAFDKDTYTAERETQRFVVNAQS